MTIDLSWPDRLQRSAAELRAYSEALQAALLDSESAALLTDPTATNDAAQAEVRRFTHLIQRALASLIDLTAFDNPDQESPDLTSGFLFQCGNVVYG